MTRKIITDIDRPTEELLASFRGHSAADVHEAMGKTNAMSPEIGRVTGRRTICGPATTVRLPTGDNMMIHVGSHLARPGDVLVIEARTTRAATWGELATRNALQRELEGVVSSGNVRDVDAIDDLGFPVFSRAVSQIGAVKETVGSVNVPVTVGEVVVDPGDIVVGDADGVTVVPRREARDVLDRLEAHVEREESIKQRIDRGEALFDIAGFDELLRDRNAAIPQDTDD
ncbi:4-carboxy-4-hydroxy-2-oxoadipate aldolase/oxaloacetate decarboxylase [Halomarina halobia]|uniref:4-carboxy-4-hydroxy-2-oxoadipate aldolase/oxaloacetate decarboxylase n=1 Tax=Halomarina halobia TaxID=3033386 RepID=A0ABD6AEQ8_9EURY|nr:4-carboxy-4-hydroxy-2-oxoadipate aldolase/oxaloacetate decarboxylase [Halomarina sp. PSR21]